MPQIPFIDLRAQYLSIKPEIDAAIARVVDSGQFVLGPEGEALEQELAAYCGTRHAAAVASGTDALILSLRACGIGPGDEVITTAYTFAATVEAILLVGATPVLVDIDPKICTLDLNQAAAAATPKTKAIIPVHLYGHPCAMLELMTMARQRGWRVIEDCAQAIGATVQGRRVGSFGDAGCLSFYPTKNLGGYGDGGMVVTNDAKMAEQVRVLRNHGGRERYQHLALGTNSRLDELQAAVLRVKLRHLDAWTQARKTHAAAYANALTAAKLEDATLPSTLPGYGHVYHLYVIQTPHRDRAQQHLAEQGIATQVAYPSALCDQPAFREPSVRCAPCPIARRVAQRVLALPMYPELSDEQIERVVKTLAESLKTN
ncbi:MAG: DegT/DnrJ/EryC1/StrS family aminotransferase [Candidatus Omnitrophica bacterium]|nr:DegT/DnrJ/EryC1/StrS family aminotransferase [Candidatus Omnitrophota bacterium]